MEEIISMPPDQYNQFLVQYIDILEKTNQQMTLFQNPYMFIVAALTLLVTFIAIGATVILWRQSREYKKTLKLSIESYEKSLNEKVKIVEDETKKMVDKIIVLEKKKMSAATKEGKVRIEEKVKELEAYKDLIVSKNVLSTISILDKPKSLKDYYELSSVPLEIHKSNSIFAKCDSCGKSKMVEIKLSGNYCEECDDKLSI
ncbi:MAG: hypothetical protein QG580_227 [Patescibacteria group bacterium]|jgi:hypothetical protein|nr:hypothetical protein [Patescibacteria group bacterium]